MKTNERLNKLPKDIQEEVKSKLKGWCDCYVEQNEVTKEFRTNLLLGITKEHNEWTLVEWFKSSDIYTEEERRNNANEYWAGAIID